VLGDAAEILKCLREHGLTVSQKFDGEIAVESQNDQSGANGANDDLVQRIWDAARKTGAAVQSITPARNSLEEIFLSTVNAPDGATMSATGEATHAAS
jgi:hypothetical protein